MIKQLKWLIFLCIICRVKGQETLVKDATGAIASSVSVATESLSIIRSFLGGLMPFINQAPFGQMLDSIGIRNGGNVNSLGTAFTDAAGGFLKMIVPGFQSLISSLRSAMANHGGEGGNSNENDDDDDDDSRGGRGGRGGRRWGGRGNWRGGGNWRG